MIDRRKVERRSGADRRSGRERRVDVETTTQWLPPYGRRKLDGSDSRKMERRVQDRRL